MSDDLQGRITSIEERIDFLEERCRRDMIRRAASFAADVHVARGLAPLGWDGATRADFEESLRAHLSENLTVLDQDEANGLAIAWMEVKQT